VEASTVTDLDSRRELPGDKAVRIVEAMRESVAARGIAGSTFDHVAREAGVSRGLLHYYFGTKERLLIEVVRRECEIRQDMLEQAVASAGSAEDVIAALVSSLEHFLDEGPARVMMFYEMLTVAQRNEEIAGELAQLGRRTRAHLANVLRAKAQAGVLELSAEPEVAAAFLFALADGVTVRRLSEPELDVAPLVGQATVAARALLS
jgi:AcrR family transcriptional regulator